MQKVFILLPILIFSAPRLLYPDELSMVTRSLIQFDKRFGSSVIWHAGDDDPLYLNNARQFSIVVPEYEMKFVHLQKKRTVYDYRLPDSLVHFFSTNGIPVRGHTLAWANYACPTWLLDNIHHPDTVCAILKDHITTTVRHYNGKLYCWDVVNEAFDDYTGAIRKNVYSDAMGAAYIDSAFTWARSEDSTVKLFYNDYYSNCHRTRYQQKLVKTHALLSRLKKNNIPVDGIGIQMHLNIDYPFNYDFYETYLDSFALLDLEIHFTEVDVGIDTPFTVKKLEQQASVYGAVMKLFLTTPACKAFVVWGFTDRYSWIPAQYNGIKGAACLLDTNYVPKTALDSINGVIGLAEAYLTVKPKNIRVMNVN